MFRNRMVAGTLRPPKVAAGAPAYDPTADAGVVAWYRADSNGPTLNGTPCSTNGQDVNGWTDDKNAWDMVCNDGTVFDFNTAALNGLPGVSCVGANGFFRPDLNAISINSATFSVFALAKPLTGGDTGGRVLTLIGNGESADHNNGKSFLMQQSGGTTQTGSFYGNGGVIGATISTVFNTPAAFGLTFSGTQARAWKSGVQQGTDTAWSTNIGGGTILGVYMFGNAGAVDAAAMQLFEIFWTTTHLGDTAGVASVSQYFQNKWGTY